ncbi:hypothetical protein F441_17602 [Phytophthora nicotianae CJ01A1]|uniref:Galactosyltransferase C-terminal domain-containing protein n=2 Tax=Phytophthora nicotianae TaxID=4792 RepID=W2G282_PHYNI|nr:hypothetical protein L915_17255 [Phytophthora nicotianae]ETL29748.1 hypothetical protein L916_17148 [Phytophthora nicotianae]ETP05894.1 hypothetical protein F441_17602 [Phytophthora nicotianae CJ01A1]
MAPKRLAHEVHDGDNKKRRRRSNGAACPGQSEPFKTQCAITTAPEETEAPPQDKRSSSAMQDTTRVAVLVPFRDNHPAQKRQAQLDEFVPYMTEFLKRHCALKSASFHIFIIDQSLDGRKFNRGKLLNAGFDMARNDYDLYIFHDVDLLPGVSLVFFLMYKKQFDGVVRCWVQDDLGELYTTIPTLGPMHIARVWDRYNESSTYFGGIVAFTFQQFIKVNGFPNNFWGWGGEDNELYSRVVRKKFSIQAPASGTIRDLEGLNLEEKLAVLRTSKVKCTVKYDLLKEHHRTWKKNGLKNLHYEYVNAEAINENCTKITVKLGPNGHWSDSRSSLELPTAPDQDLESYLVLTVPEAASAKEKVNQACAEDDTNAMTSNQY